MSITNCDEFYLKKYAKYIENAVNKFIAKGGGRSSYIKDDLLQEARLALLKWIKKQPSSNFDISKSFLFIDKELFKYVNKNTGIKMDIRRFSEFCKCCQIVPIEDTHITNCDFSDIDYAIDLNKWEKTLPVKQKVIVALKLAGFTNMEISRKLGIPFQNITRYINDSIRNSYNAYFHPEQNPAPARKRKSKSAPTAA